MNIYSIYSQLMLFIHKIVYFIHKKQLTLSKLSGILPPMKNLRRSIMIITTTTRSEMVVIG